MEQIERQRVQMNDQLIFDVLLSTGGVRHPEKLYPPHNVEQLGLLLDAIQDSAYDTLKKDCLIYYLLKAHKDGREEFYRDEKCIPPQFSLLADAYWFLDTGIHIAVSGRSTQLYFTSFYSQLESRVNSFRRASQERLPVKSDSGHLIIG